MLNKTIKFLGKSYTIPMPKMGQILEIETMKHHFSLGNYGKLMEMRTSHAMFALDVIDAMAYFTVLSPEIREQIKTENWEELDITFASNLASSMKIWHEWFLREKKRIKSEVEAANAGLIEKREESNDLDKQQ